MNLHYDFIQLIKNKTINDIIHFYNEHKNINLFTDEDALLYEAIINEKIEIAKFLFDKRDKKEPLFDLECLIMNMLSTKNLELISFIFDIYQLFNKNTYYDNYLIGACKENNEILIEYILQIHNSINDYLKINLYMIQLDNESLYKKFYDLYKNYYPFDINYLSYYIKHCSYNFFYNMKKICLNKNIEQYKYEQTIKYFILNSNDVKLKNSTINTILNDINNIKIKNNSTVIRNIQYLIEHLDSIELENKLGNYILSSMYSCNIPILEYLFSLKIYNKHSFIKELEIRTNNKYRNYIEYILFLFDKEVFDYFYDYLDDDIHNYAYLLKAINYKKLYLLEHIKIDNNLVSLHEIKNILLKSIYKKSSEINNIEDIYKLNNNNNNNNLFKITKFLINNYEKIKNDVIFIGKVLLVEFELFNKDNIDFYLKLLNEQKISNKKNKELNNLFELYLKKNIYIGGNSNVFELLNYIKEHKTIFNFKKMLKIINDIIEKDINLSISFLSDYYKETFMNIQYIYNNLFFDNNIDNLYKFIYIENNLSFIKDEQHKNNIIQYIKNKVDLTSILINEYYDIEFIQLIIQENLVEISENTLNELNINKILLNGNIDYIYIFLKIQYFNDKIIEFLNLPQYNKECDNLFITLLKTKKYSNIYLYLNYKKNINLKKYTSQITKHIFENDNLTLLKLNVLNLVNKKNIKILTSFLVKIILVSINSQNLKIISWCLQKIIQYNLEINNEKILEMCSNIKIIWFNYINENIIITEKINIYNSIINLLNDNLKSIEISYLLIQCTKVEYYEYFLEYKNILRLNNLEHYDLETQNDFIENKKLLLNRIIINTDIKYINYYIQEIYDVFPISDIELKSIFFNFNKEKANYFNDKILNFYELLTNEFFESLLEEYNNDDNDFSNILCNILKYIYELKPEYFKDIYNNKLFQLLCFYGYNDSIEYLLYVNKENIDISSDNEEAFKCACESGMIRVIKYLLNEKNDIDISNNNEEAIKRACNNGHLQTVKLLMKLKPSIQLSANNDIIFSSTCSEGHINILHWLHLKLGNNINNDSIVRYGICNACHNGELLTAKWLYKKFKNIDITIDEDSCFIGAAKNNQINVCKWIQKLIPKRYSFSIINERYEIPYISSYNVNKQLILNESFEINDEIKECYICMCDESSIVTTCNHQTCFECMERYYKITCPLKCPYCRADNIKLYKIIKPSTKML